MFTLATVTGVTIVSASPDSKPSGVIAAPVEVLVSPVITDRLTELPVTMLPSASCKVVPPGITTDALSPSTLAVMSSAELPPEISESFETAATPSDVTEVNGN
jgi:hypothetical protein